MNEQNNLRGSGLDPELVKVLALEGIETFEDLIAPPMTEIADINAVGKDDLGAIYDLREKIASERRDVNGQQDAVSDTPASARTAPAKPVVTSRGFMVQLHVRHAEWIDEQVALTGQTASKVIEYCVRQIYGKDHQKAGRRYNSEGGGTVLARDNPDRHR